MKKSSPIYSILAFTALACLSPSCKKDLLHYQSAQKIESGTTDRLNDILFINDSTGFIVGGQRFASATILTTHDGGYTWSDTSFPEAGKELFGISQSPNGNIYTCGYDGKLLYSADTGRGWTFRQLFYNPYKRVLFPTSDKGIVIGGISFESGFIEYIDAQGNTIYRDSMKYEINDIVMLNSHTGYMCGYGVILKTDDGGESWELLNVKGDNFNCISVYNGELWVSGYNGSVYHSSDNGTTWQKLRNGNDISQTTYHLTGILFKDAQNGWAVGEQGAVLHSDDGGKHWSQYDKFTSEDLERVKATPNGDIMVVGTNGTIYRLKV
ncbi:MAG: hypothetical protein JSS82_20440 [Bacteroidetes bacterium]|nr:hypothetical protein [Bacteroidota bacterium]